jgi:hypothetical protein
MSAVLRIGVVGGGLIAQAIHDRRPPLLGPPHCWPAWASCPSPPPASATFVAAPVEEFSAAADEMDHGGRPAMPRLPLRGRTDPGDDPSVIRNLGPAVSAGGSTPTFDSSRGPRC